MLEILLIIAVVLLTALVFVAGFYLWKFVKIIMIFEDDLSAAMEGLGSVEDALVEVLEMQMFFDSPEVKQAVQNIIEHVQLCRMTMTDIIGRFTARSKRQYVTVWDTEPEENDSAMRVPRLPGQPPGTPNPMETIHREGMLLDVRHK